MFAGKKSAQIREILINESAWEEMTCLFAPSLDITMIASRGNVADTGITDRVNDIINDRFWSDGKKPDRCDVLQELIDCGDISAKDAKSTQKAWNCRHSRQSNDKKR